MDQPRNMADWTRRRKMIATVSIAATLVIGIFIGTLVNGKVSAMHSFSFAGTSAAPLALPDPIPSSSSFSGIVNRVEPAVVNIATTQVIDRKSRKHHARAIRTTRAKISSFISLTISPERRPTASGRRA